MSIVRPTNEGSYCYSFDFEKNMCVVTGKGNVDLPMTKRAMSALKDHPLFDPAMHILIDLREIYFHPSYDELMSIRDHLVLLKANYNSSMAVVTGDELYYIALLVSKLIQTAGMNMNVFKSMEKAESWLFPNSAESIVG